jgi:hypothetical protein
VGGRGRKRPDRTQLANEFSELCHAALTALYHEVIE